MDELSGLHIIVTRPSSQAEPWVHELQALGAQVQAIPLLDIVPVVAAEQIQAIKNCILNFDLYNKAIFVSQNAVTYGCDWLDNYWPQLPHAVEFFAVGETTANLLQERGATVTDLAQTQTGAMNSEALLQSSALHNVTNDRILIFRGVGGRPHLGEELSARGAQVDYCELYERLLPVSSREQFALLLAKPPAPLVITVLSVQALENLQHIFQQLDKSVQQLADNIILLVPGERIFAQAQAAGFTQVFAAENATNASMLQGLMDLKRNFKRSSIVSEINHSAQIEASTNAAPAAAVYTEAQPAANSVAAQKKSRFGVWVALVLIVLIASVAAFLWQQYKSIHQLQSALTAQALANEHARKVLETKVADDLASQSKQVQGEVTELTQRLDSTTSKVLALTNLSRDDWKLTEVDYLLRMANQRILMEHEASDSLALAESANGVLAELQNADLFAARKKLTEEIEALKLANKVDREGIYLQLLALTQQIENLPLIEPLVEEDEENIAQYEQGEEATSPTFWQRVKNFGKRTWHKLSTYVRVRDQGRRVDAILPPEDQMYLKQNLRLMLEQAQIGLLREEQHVYQASLDKAQNWIRDYYPLNDQAQIVLNDIDQLKKNNVQQPLPDFSGSAALVKDYIRQKDRLSFSRNGGN